MDSTTGRATATGAHQLLDRILAVLHACEEAPGTLGEVMARTGLPRATAYRLATALEERELLCRHAGRWALGPALARLGAVAASGPPLAQAARRALEALRDATGESAQLYVRRGDERVCVVSLESPHSLRTMVPVGVALPLTRGSAGRILGSSPVSGVGWAESVEEREPGVASVSAPVRDMRPGAGGAIVAAVSVSGPVERTTRAPGARYGNVVVAAAAAIERAAGLCPLPEDGASSGSCTGGPIEGGRHR